MGAEDERSLITTAYGWGIHVLAILAATEVWHLVNGKQLTPSARAQFKGVLFGAVMLTAGGIPLWLGFSRSVGFVSIIGNLLELGLLAGSIFTGVQLTKRTEGKTSWPAIDVALRGRLQVSAKPCVRSEGFHRIDEFDHSLMDMMARRAFECPNVETHRADVIRASMVLVWHAGQSVRMMIMMLRLGSGGSVT
jgi:hypothetical protein